MRGYLFLFLFICSVGASFGQVYKITYHAIHNDQVILTDPVIVFANKYKTVITRESIMNNKFKQTAEQSIIDIPSKLIYRKSTFQNRKSIYSVDSSAFNRTNFSDTKDFKTILGKKAQKSTTSINSNSIEIYYTTELPIHAAPNDVGLNKGWVMEYRRNGNSGYVATKIEEIKDFPSDYLLPSKAEVLDILTYRDEVWKSKFIQIPIFKNEKICFDPDNLKSDSILRFAAGTVILKKIKVPALLNESQAFIELVEKSNGDAYDRTGSVFFIADDQPMTFLDGMKNGMNTLPRYDVGDGKDYLGMIRTGGYSPIFELMRFFTPFGVSHFNDRLALKGKTWQDSVTYRQDISEFLGVMAGKEIYVGTYIGNYDKGGHIVSLEMTIHPGNSNYAEQTNALSLFNTTNVMEMGGQTYPTLFGSAQGLDFEFELKEDVKNARLRYITTGHGGWWNGDEFVPKVNSIYLNNELKFQFTPWRVDCGSYRLYNPVSGNFDSGLSSSDLSRSNWCPGTITYPNYISLGNLKAGTYKIKVHIPQGPPERDSQSFWNVSGALLFEN
ncbi:PNGase F N-terminal domain-containing protein [Sphingobacterium bovistauri]|uniref:Peptide-N-glycosidase n=1 Tax=Sphingobacterium bovistauri TaxID=2781959 RepID=A0ABS7Z3X2_9SPHI|nr:PNGase F N-terminal domain-containing protein [Sphingobacterium bovistauri]MCA5004864.1 peptide-N-glycosidase [Sphingobacterium bovistauri]